MKIKKIAVDKLQGAPYNPRQIDEASQAGLRASIARFGLVDPLIYNEQSGHLVGGHQRLKILQEQNIKYADCVIVSLNEQEEKILNITLNNRKIQGDWDTEKLLPLLLELQTLPEFADLRLADLQTDLFPPTAPEVKEDGAEGGQAQNMQEPRVKPGDVWQLSEHRLMCGDSTNGADVEKLLAGRQPVLMATDPPYGVQYDPEWREGCDLGVGKRSCGKVDNDDQFDWSVVWGLWQVPVLYVWHSAKHAIEVATGLIAHDYQIVAQIIWAKQHFVISRGDYHWQHEPCWYAIKHGHAHNWQEARDQTTLWQIQNNNCMGGQGEEKFGHSTQKPIECMARPIQNNSAVGDVVCDPFVGSGTTIIAAEQLNRKCLAMEINPAYCAMAITLWEKFTGKKASKI